MHPRPSRSAPQSAYRSAHDRAGQQPYIDGSAEALSRLIAAQPTLEDRLRLLVSRVPGRIAFSTSLGLEDQALLHAIATTGVGVDVLTLDTGRHFPETLDTIAASEARYGLQIRVVAPDAADLEVLVARDGINGFRASIEARKACCDVRKVRPLRRALTGATGWITGLRRGQSSGRATVPFAENDAAFGLLKVNPIADWTLDRLEAYIAAHAIPTNPLHARGFPSIGCQPCTRAIRPGEDLRAGRWWWETLAGRALAGSDGQAMDGQECGLHTRSQPNRSHTEEPAR